MSRYEPLVSKENWQNYTMNPGPSNVLSHMGAPKSAPSPGRPLKPTWHCLVCRKELSSKRSYTEHMNIHNKQRPFQCEHCAYAAASQMTLHRHKLRNHTPKTEWGYRCPYCEDAYMEPAGYQQHVQQRHPGKSATYGCPFGKCKFVSKSQRHFREHLPKHEKCEKVEDGIDPCGLSNQELVRYMVMDEIGLGYKPLHVAPMIAIRAIPKVQIAPKIYARPTGRTCSGQNWLIERVIPNKTVIRNNQIPVPRHLEQQQRLYEAPSSAGPSEYQDYQQSHLEYDETEHESCYDAKLEHEMNGNVEYEVEEQYEDDGPPVLESFGLVNSKMDRRIEEDERRQWMEKQHEQEVEPTPKEGVFPNGSVDFDLD
ncbi:hypothetical protein L5515_009916 [Caenorhabditis briggsae]|uniref:C2H2-type domain-containing protein n=1 Tax=Caenorhabditis briggsae TaxID=6238 RepID=A0AAE9A734_CAEBR|nr:hypothetical protein L3Y34_010116 [Caenorhabditis briggsae]UMM38543.1 hypothetical protein L5515_009916 [Caenorhabditis briggsae]